MIPMVCLKKLTRRRRAVALGLALAVVPLAGAALADHAPAYVIPTVSGVPIVIAHQDASYAVVESDFGLYRPGAVHPTVIRRWDGGVARGHRGYFPRSGHRPGYGRLEVVPPANRRRPPPAESYFRSWHAGSGPEPATSPGSEMVPIAPPEVILAPPEKNRHFRPPRR